MDKSTKEQFEKILANHSKTKEKFVDLKFRADNSSLYGPLPQETNYDSETKWLRPRELRHFAEDELDKSDSEWTVMSDDLSPEDICQGQLGNCWFITALAVVAQKPELLKNIILTNEVNSAGVYVIRLCKDGRWHSIIVDDRFPCDQHNRLKYATSRRKQLWVSLIEKAMAKLHGSYDALQAGQSHEGLSALTGYSSHSVELNFDDEGNPGSKGTQKKDLVWQIFLAGARAGFLMGASCGKKDDDNEKYNKVSLQNKHAYSVLDVRSIQGFRLMQLRNPWGRDSFVGDWDAKSGLWTPELMEKLKPPPEDHGIFWISYDDVIRYFSYVDICQLRYNWDENRFENQLPIFSDSKFSCYYIDVTKPTELEATLYQSSTRAKASNGNNEELKSDLCVAIFSLSKSQYEKDQTIKVRKLVGYSIRSLEASTIPRFQDGILQPGAYLVLPLSFQKFRTGIKKGVSLAIHSSAQILVKELQLAQKFLSEAIISFTVGTGTKKSYDGKIILYTKTKQFAGISVVAENANQDKWAHLEFDFRGSNNLVSSRSDMLVFDVIPPQHRQLITILTQAKPNESCLTSYQMKYRITTAQTLEDWAPKGPKNATNIPPLNEEIGKQNDLHCPRPVSNAH